MTTGGRLAGAAAAVLATLAIGAATRTPWAASPADGALLRLSWRAPSEVAEQCRPLSEEEKADLPVHMQVPELCEARAIPYLLEVHIDGATFAADTIHGAGAREDRPVTVFREFPIAVGEHAIDIAFRPLVQERDEDEEDEDEDADDDRNDAGDEEGHVDSKEEGERDGEEDDEAVALTYSRRVTLGPREVALLTFDPEQQVLVRVESP